MKKILLLIFSLPIFVLAQSQFTIPESRRIGEILSQDPNNGDFMSPLVLSNSILFFYIGKAQNVSVAGDFNNWQDIPMIESKTNLWVLSYKTRTDAGKYQYRYKVDGFWIADPLNPASEYDQGRQQLSILNLAQDFTPEKKYPFWVSNNTYQFRYFNTNARIVTIAGDFNNWNPYSHQMTYKGAGFFELDLELAPKKIYTYSFVVDGKWVFDPNNSQQYRNEFKRPVSAFYADQLNSKP